MEASDKSAPMDDVSLVALAQQGDAAAFSELVSRYDRKIFRLARHITNSEEDAEDVLQETRRIPRELEVLHLARAHRRERIAYEAA
jgi:hypothetical protein